MMFDFNNYPSWMDEIEGLKPQQVQMYIIAWNHAMKGECPGFHKLVEIWEQEVSPHIQLKDVSIVIDRLICHAYFVRNGYYEVPINDFVPGWIYECSFDCKGDNENDIDSI